MKKTLAIVLALAMVLCMIPAAFAQDGTFRYEQEQYNLEFFSYQKGAGPYSDGLVSLAHKSNANTITAKYNFEEEKAEVTGQFTEDRKMGVLEIKGWNEAFDGVSADDVTVYVDGKQLEVNQFSDYSVGNKVGWRADPRDPSVYIPVELTKSGYSTTYLVEVEYYDEPNNDTYIQTAKISLRLENTAAYKNAKTAYIADIQSNDDSLDAYIVGDKIYLDFVYGALPGQADELTDWDPVGYAHKVYGQTIDITFANENHKAFDVVTWAYEAKDVDTGDIYFSAKDAQYVGERWGKKLDSDSSLKFEMFDVTDKPTVKFELETADAIYETKEYDVVYRDNVVEADPKGIYFAETTKTIAIGETYTPVVMGVATNKKVKADLVIGTGTDKQVIDIDDKSIIGTQEGVAYITAKYTTNDKKTYTSSSMKIVVTPQGATEETTDGKTYMVTASSLRVRSGAGTNFSQIGSLKNGATVKVESIANGWAKLENGGYVSAQYLAEVVDNGEAQTMYVTARTLNVRKGPGTSYAKVGTLSRGTAVQVVGFSGNWAKLSNGYYVSTSYLAK